MKRTALKRDTPKALAWLRRFTPLKAKGRKYAEHRKERFGPKAKWIKTLPCIVCGAKPVDPHHDPPRSLGGTSMGLIPLCRRHHNVRHQLGPTRFNERYTMDLLAYAAYFEMTWRARR